MKRILYVDADGSSSAHAAFLEKEGHKVITAGDKFEALSTALQSLEHGQPVDLVVLTVEMPPADSLELIDRLRAAGTGVACLALLPFLDEDLLVELLRRKCLDYMERPVSPEDLARRVRNMLDERREEGPASREEGDPKNTQTAIHIQKGESR